MQESEQVAGGLVILASFTLQ